MIKASGRSALILVTGLFVCFAMPSQAAPDADKATASSKSESAKAATAANGKQARRSARSWKKYAQRKPSRTALKSSASKKATDDADNSVGSPAKIPPSVANANAQLASTEAPADSARAMSAKATTILQAAADKPADSQVVSADQLNDLDRALQESRPPAPALALASAEPPAAPLAIASSKEDSTWDRTSLIGKIFIGFGALLTMASAARMFMA
ncbi:hypothetical protein KMZ68_09900 [Bradyrhizobium sediminis]|uniref:Uncharacterized protein n=1 Tax=Bradyrhizobium sediminis TaxID=2840469 RepID=A0A975RVF3_9BRAD|nr:hypothetical protein [Bradyrhizobium sediminis]QWG20821.1 hypothetical protein KMZ68_09900 [Bradyrhizobium sediminis]